MTFLIDGYNLMFAEGYLAKQTQPKRFERKRGEFLDWLALQVKGRGVNVLVIFDAQEAVGPSKESVHKGVRVRFAYRQTADDVIEQLLSREAHPQQLAVVSNDVRLKDAARRRGSGALSTDDFLDWLERRDPIRPEAPPPEKPEGPVPPGERDDLLQAFAIPRPKRRGK